MARQQDTRRRGGTAANRPAIRAAQQAERARCAAVLASVSAGPQVLLFDDFNRPDGPLGTAPTGQVWDLDFPDVETGIRSGGMHCSFGAVTADVGSTTYEMSVEMGAMVEGYVTLLFAYHPNWWSAGSGAGSELSYSYDEDPTNRWTLKMDHAKDTDPPSTVIGGVGPVLAPGDTITLRVEATRVIALVNNVEVVRGNYPAAWAGSTSWLGANTAPGILINSITVTAL